MIGQERGSATGACSGILMGFSYEPKEGSGGQKICMKGLFCEFTRDYRMTEYIRAWESRMEAPFRTFFDTGAVPCLCCAVPDADRVASFEAIGERRRPHLLIDQSLPPFIQRPDAVRE